MKAYFHSLEPVVMPREEYLNEHIRLVNALSSGKPEAIMKELVEQRKDLGDALKGGRAGVSKASGFVMRAMAENKAKHSGQYKNPTFPLAPGSKMKKAIEFDWRKLANSSQGGIGEPGKKVHWGNKGDYGASPFILHHFSGEPKSFKSGDRKDYPKETDTQRKARMVSMARNLMKKAGQLVEKANGSPQLVISEMPPELKEHFGNVEAKEPEKAEAPKPPISPPETVVEPEPPKEAPVVAPVVAEKPKKVPVKKVAESPTPSNPVPKKVWTEEDVATNPILVNYGSYGWYMEHNDRWKKLYLFGLNNPTAKLKDAIKYLEDNKIGKGFSSSLISPIWKQVKDAVDEDYPKLAEQQKTLQNPAFANIKEKFDTLLASKKGRKFENIDKLKLPAFKNVDLKPYLEAYSKLKTHLAGQKLAESYMPQRITIKGNEGFWKIHYKLSDDRYIKEPEGVWRNGWKIGFDVDDFKRNGTLPMGDIKDSKGDKAGIKLYGKPRIVSIESENGKLFFNSTGVKVWLQSDDWKDPTQLPGDEYEPQPRWDSSNPRKRKPEWRVFEHKGIYEYQKKIDIGRELEYFQKDMMRDDRGRKLNSKVKRTLLIGTTRKLKHDIAHWNEYEYTMNIGDEEYVSPKRYSYDKFFLDEVPEEKITEFSPDLFGKGEYILNKVSEADAKDPEEIKRLPIRNKARYDKAKTALLEALSNYTVPPITTRMNAIGNATGKLKAGKGGDVGRGVAFGFGNNRRGYDYYVKNKEHPEVYKALVEFGEAIVPKGWDFQTIQLNHNVKAKKHSDKHNVGKSVIIGIGDYTGGELRVFSPDSSKHQDYNLKDTPVMFNGSVLPHEGQQFQTPTEYKPGHGRYTIVYFRHKYKPKGSNVGVGAGESKGLRQPPKAEIEDMFV